MAVSARRSDGSQGLAAEILPSAQNDNATYFDPESLIDYFEYLPCSENRDVVIAVAVTVVEAVEVAAVVVEACWVGRTGCLSANLFRLFHLGLLAGRFPVAGPED